MRHLLSIQNLTKYYGEKSLFEQVNLSLSPSERMGLVGVNGSGKSTLLKMITGTEDPDEGQIDLNPKTQVSVLSQNPVMDDRLTVLDYLFQGDSPALRLLRDYENAVLALNERPDDPTCQKQFNDLSQRMTSEDGWSAEAKAKAVLTRLGLRDFSGRLGQLSGGQRRRAALARTLLDPADLLILDEPTNHLDPDTVDWLEGYLNTLNCALLLVTHDRYFLDRVVDHILEIEQGQIHRFQGNYSIYLEKKVEREALKQKYELDRQNLLQKELDWLRHAPMARGSKQKARIQRAETMLETAYVTPQQSLDITIASRRTGKRIMEINHISKAFDSTVLIQDFSYIINRGDRLGIVGPNGVGKTTLLNILTNRLKPDTGNIVLGQTIHIGYYDQETHDLNENQQVLDYISETAAVIKTGPENFATAAQMLSRFQFSRKVQRDFIGTLSGGERRRLYLLRTLMLAPNVLILDEPTNDLDIQTLTILEDYLDSFAGILIIVSHDRYFLDRTVQHIFAFEGEGRIKQYPGNYSAYREKKAYELAAQPKPEAPSSKKSSKSQAMQKPRKLSSNERRQMEDLENQIEALELKKENLAEQINQAGSDYQRLQTLSETLSQTEVELDEAMEQWAALAELADG